MASKLNNNPSLRVTADGRVYRVGRRVYPNKDVYEGEFIDGLRHGKGVLMMYDSKDLYNGEFENNVFHGYGVYNWGAFYDENKNKITTKRYEGEFKDGLRHGKGVFLFGNGDAYHGEFQRGHYHGQGTLTMKNGDVYTGEWRVGRVGGKVKIEYHNGDVYEGWTNIGKYEGVGKLTYANKLGTYDGEWKRGQRHGKGTRMYSNGNKYVGEFKENELDGEGIMFFVNGDQYVGQFHRGHMDGKGCYVYAFGDKYEGEFRHGVIHGEGKYTYADGGYYSGEYKNMRKAAIGIDAMEFPVLDGVRHGFGVRVFTNGSKYEGKWENGLMHSETSQLVKADGSKYEGGFRNGQRHGPGREEYGNMLDEDYVCPLGHKHKGEGYCVYTGDFRRDLYHGYGELICQDGRRYKGEYKDGRRHGQGYYYYLRDGDIGDPQRCFIGGNDSMYRVKEYSGTWDKDERHGIGVVSFINGDKVEGQMYKGQPNGLCLYRFANGHTRHANYVRGERVSWMDLAMERAHVKAMAALKKAENRAADQALLKALDENARLFRPPPGKR